MNVITIDPNPTGQLDSLREKFEMTAEWRREKARDYPDTERTSQSWSLVTRSALPYLNRIFAFRSGVTRSGVSYFAQCPDGHCHRLLKRYANANRTQLNGGERSIGLATQSAVARSAQAQSQAPYARA